MTKIIEAVYEQGALKLENTSGLKEHQRYRVIVEEIIEPQPPNNQDLVAEALDELRRERAAHLDAELDEFFPSPISSTA